MIINELFQMNGLPAGVSWSLKQHLPFYFQYEITIVRDKGEPLKYKFTFQKEGDGTTGIWNVVLKLISKLDNGEFDPLGITKTGYATYVFAAVAECMRSFLITEKDKIKGLHFSAEESSRYKLYHVLAKKLAETLGWKLELDNTHKIKGFLILKPDTINELQITKDLKNRFASPKEILAKYGWNVLGYGADGAVAENPNEKYVLKLFSTDSKYTDFVKYIAQPHQNNPHLPKISKAIKQIPGTAFSYIGMEKLQKISSKELVGKFFPEMCVLKIDAERYNMSFAMSYDFTFSDQYRQVKLHGNDIWNKIRKPDDAWFSLSEMLYSFARKEKLNIDLHDDNFMLRGNTLVIIDPYNKRL